MFEFFSQEGNSYVSDTLGWIVVKQITKILSPIFVNEVFTCLKASWLGDLSRQSSKLALIRLETPT